LGVVVDAGVEVVEVAVAVVQDEAHVYLVELLVMLPVPVLNKLLALLLPLRQAL